MRVLFCGSGDFGIPSLKAILASRHEIAGVITQPPRPAGRGGGLRPTAVAHHAPELGLEAAALEDINDPESLRLIADVAPDVIFVADFGQLIAGPVRAAAKHQAFNLHGSLLPALRGAAPVNWAIIKGHAVTGVTTFLLADRMDAGPIYACQPTEIRPDETADQLRARLAELGAGLVCRTLEMISQGSPPPAAQDESKATRVAKLKKSDGWIDFSAEAVTIRNLVHGTWPWPGGQAVLADPGGRGELHVTIARARTEEGGGGEPGTLDGDLTVATGKGRLRILQIKPAGKRLMEWRDFVNGHRLREGCRFLTPRQ